MKYQQYIKCRLKTTERNANLRKEAGKRRDEKHRRLYDGQGFFEFDRKRMDHMKKKQWIILIAAVAVIALAVILIVNNNRSSSPAAQPTATPEVTAEPTEAPTTAIS